MSNLPIVVILITVLLVLHFDLRDIKRRLK